MYRDEFEAIQSQIKEKQLVFDFKLITAFSRETSQKVYVQHKLFEHKSKVWALLGEQRGYFYICGDAKRMAADVTKTLEHIAVEEGHLSASDAQQWLKNLRNKGRFLEDVWS